MVGLEPTLLSSVKDTYLASHSSDGRLQEPVTPVGYKYENKGFKKPFSLAPLVNLSLKLGLPLVDTACDYAGTRRWFVCAGPHLQRDCHMRTEGATSHSSSFSNSGGNKKFNASS
jgi:hypothetical protein